MFSNRLLTHTALLLEHCRARRLKLVTAESCTGGLLAALITEVPGCSDVFQHGFVTYSNDAKHGLLGVPDKLLERYGAVSQEVARAMAIGVLKGLPGQLSLSITGIAGPAGGTKEKPVGLVYISSKVFNNEPIVLKRNFSGDRQQIRIATVEAAIDLLHAQAQK